MGGLERFEDVNKRHQVVFQGVYNKLHKTESDHRLSILGGNPLHLSAIAAGVELPALLQLIHECCQAIQVVQFVMHTFSGNQGSIRPENATFESKPKGWRSSGPITDVPGKAARA
jgi:hypothetical protein